MFLLLLNISLASNPEDIFAIDDIIFDPGSNPEQTECVTENNTKDNLLMCKKDINELLYKMKLIINSQKEEETNATK